MFPEQSVEDHQSTRWQDIQFPFSRMHQTRTFPARFHFGQPLAFGYSCNWVLLFIFFLCNISVFTISLQVCVWDDLCSLLLSYIDDSISIFSWIPSTCMKSAQWDYLMLRMDHTSRKGARLKLQEIIHNYRKIFGNKSVNYLHGSSCLRDFSVVRNLVMVMNASTESIFCLLYIKFWIRKNYILFLIQNFL